MQVNNLNPKISIIYPCYDRFEFTKRTLPQLAELNEIELVVISDGNTPEYNSFLRECADVLIIHEEREGLRNSIIDGINASTSEYVQKIDNDVLFPNIVNWFSFTLEHVDEYSLITPSMYTDPLSPAPLLRTTTPNGIYFIKRPESLPSKTKDIGDIFSAAHFHQQELRLRPMARCTKHFFIHLGEKIDKSDPYYRETGRVQF